MNLLIFCSWYKYTFDNDPSDPVRTHSGHSFCILSDFARLFALTSARFCARRRFSPQNRALGLSVFGNHIVVAKLVEAARAKLFSHCTARIERFENYPFMTDDHKSSFMFAKYYLFL